MPSFGIEPKTQGFSVPCSTNWANWAKVAGIGFEPMTSGLWARRASRLLHPAILYCSLKEKMGRGGFEPPKQVAADLQSVPFGHSGIYPLYTIWNCIKPMIGLEPITCWLQISCSANWATSAWCKSFYRNGTYRARTCDPLLVRQMLSQLS